MKMPKFKKVEELKTESKKSISSRAFQGGTYSLLITVVVLAILVAVNVFAEALPSSMTKHDISSSKIYSITSNTKVVVNTLEEDVTIYWIVQADAEDDVIENLLSKYESLSEYINVVKKNPDVYPTFAQQYTDEVVQNNSLVVECGERSRFISNEDIYPVETDLYTYSTYVDSFDGEGAITSAIDYVVREELPKLYLLEGHGEAELPPELQKQMEKENIEFASLSLLTVDEIPEDADCLMIYAPSSDISQEEQEMLVSYVMSGGKLFVAAGPVEEGNLTNLHGLLANYNVEVAEGIVLDEDREHYAFGYPYILLPDIASSEITDSLLEENYYTIMPLAEGLVVKDTTGAVTTLLNTSEYAFSKTAGYNFSSYEWEEGDVEGPFALAVSVVDSSGGEMVWFSSAQFLEEMYNAYSSGANMDLSMNALSSLIGESEAMAIRSKSLNYEYLTISDSTSSLLKVLMIGVFPLTYLGIGIYVVMRRRELQNETV